MELIDSVSTPPRSSKQNMGFILDCSKLYLRKLIIKILEEDYYDFSQIANESGLSVEEKIYEIIEYYLLIQRGRFKTCRFFPDST